MKLAADEVEIVKDLRGLRQTKCRAPARWREFVDVGRHVVAQVFAAALRQ